MIVASNHRCAAGVKDGAWTTVDSLGQRSKELTCGQGTTQNIMVQGIGESRYGADAGASFGIEFKW
jgi:hypothetical protein